MGIVMSIEWSPVNSNSIYRMVPTKVLPIEVAIMTAHVPPRPFVYNSTVCVTVVIVLVKSGKQLTIVSFHGITCCACVTTNVKTILGPRITNREKTIIGKLLHTNKSERVTLSCVLSVLDVRQ